MSKSMTLYLKGFLRDEPQTASCTGEPKNKGTAAEMRPLAPSTDVHGHDPK